MEPHRHAAPVSDLAKDDRHMLGGVEGHAVGIGMRRTGVGGDGKVGDPLDQLFAPLTPGDQVGDRDQAQPMFLGKAGHVGAALDGAVVVDEFGEHADRLQFGEFAEVDRGLGVAGTHEHATIAGDQREDVAGPHELGCTGIGVGERPHGVAALLRRDAGGQAVAEIDRDGEGGAERRVVVGNHRLELQPPRGLARHRRADDAGGVADDEADLFRAWRGRRRR